MIVKYFIIFMIMAIYVTASDLHFGTDLESEPIPKKSPTDVRERAWRTTDAFENYLHDSDNRISDDFKISPFYFNDVNFWFMIYTQFDSSQVVIHDRKNLQLIYRVLDYTSLHKKKFSANVLYVLQQKISDERVKDIKDILSELMKNPFSLEPKVKSVLYAISQAGLVLPEEKPERAAYFRQLRDNLRSQTGQRNFIRDGLARALPYKAFKQNYFKQRNLPPELLAIPFLESSFNPIAESRVAAAGAWQFMPLIASYFLPKRTSSLDYRISIPISTVGATFLMQENFKIMKSWDLAVTAYNSGTKHLVRTKRELKNPSATLEDVINHSDSKHFGFASKNFYSEFLALVHALAYQDELFPGLHENDRPDVEDDIRFYVMKCSSRLDKILNESQLEDVYYHNHHLSKKPTLYSRGTLLVSKTELPSKKFHELSLATVSSKKPLEWMKEISNQSCSMR